MVLMALDYGSKTVGVAVSDALGIAAHPLETIIREHENKLRRTLARIEEIVLERGVEKIILGKPLHMDSSEGERVKKTEDFKLLLEKRLGKEIIYIDERLTSAEAKELLSESGIKAGEMKKYIDSVAAALMLKEYMAAESRGRENDERQ
ncbi:MAG: Holliday junction resolvase RuvX [Johnsonella sp.]|nr:Holliday junction resolvase RuvX [Johnsonella sp.]